MLFSRATYSIKSEATRKIFSIPINSFFALTIVRPPYFLRANHVIIKVRYVLSFDMRVLPFLEEVPFFILFYLDLLK